MSARSRLLLVLLLAAALRVLRAGLRWDEVAWQYAAYTGPTVEALSEGRWLDACTTWIGLHPPLWPLLHAVQELIVPAPAVFLLTSAFFSLLAVLAFRDKPLVALLLATSPVQLAYAAEVNDYPLVAALVALAWAWRERPLRLAALLALSCWTHVLAAFVVLSIALSHRQWRALAGLLAGLPLAPGALELVQDAHTYSQPPLRPGDSLADLVSRFGGLGLGLLPFAALGARALPRVALALGAGLVFYAGLVLVGIAAPHQFMYLLAFGPPAFLLVDAGAQGRWRLAVVALALVQGGWWLGFEGLRAARVAEPQERAIDVAIETSAPGEALYLLASSGNNDDDKGLVSPVLWRLRPWTPMPMARPYAFAYDDHRHGQPRAWRGRTVYLNDHLRSELDQAIGAHERLQLIVYDAPPGLLAEVEARFGEGEAIGPDHRWVFGYSAGGVEGLDSSGAK